MYAKSMRKISDKNKKRLEIPNRPINYEVLFDWISGKAYDGQYSILVFLPESDYRVDNLNKLGYILDEIASIDDYGNLTPKTDEHELFDTESLQKIKVKMELRNCILVKICWDK